MNLVLIGFRGTGKTSVGKEVAAALGRAFVDSDDLVTARAGRGIPEIFDKFGEPGFRDLEAQAIASLAAADGLVIACGGGAVLDPANLAVLKKNGVIVLLTAEAEEIRRRIQGSPRPRLTSLESMAEIRHLLRERGPLYAQAADHTLDTTKLSAPEAAQKVIGLANALGPAEGPSAPAIVPVLPGAPEAHEIVIGSGALERLAALVAQTQPSVVAVVSGNGVPSVHLARVQEMVESTGVRVALASFDDREANKRLASVEALSSSLLEQGVDRRSLLVAVGGGIACDLGGLVAATFMRGIPHVLVPTTLLAMVDAAIGGKTAANLPQAKNAVGCFKQPLAVLVDPAFLTTLPRKELLNGFAEAVKHGVIADKGLLEFMDAHAPALLAREEPLLTEFIARNARIKAALVSLDPHEQGPRKALNYGHTLGHALEALAEFKGLSHGQAVAVGMAFEARLSRRLGGLSAADVEFQDTLLARLGFSTRLPSVDPDKLLARMAFDKKNVGGTLRFALPASLGRMMNPDGSHAVAVPVPEIRALLEASQ